MRFAHTNIATKFAVTEGARIWIFWVLMIMLTAEALWILAPVIN